MITPQLLDVLLAEPKFLDFIEAIKKKNYRLDEAPIGDCETFREDLFAIVKQKIKDKEAAWEDVHEDIVSAKTLQRYFKLDRKFFETDGRWQKSLNALLIFAGIPRDRWSYYYYEDPDYNRFDKRRLVGMWHVFLYEGDDIIRTRLRIYYGVANNLLAEYRSAQNLIYKNGTITFHGGVMSINFMSKDDLLTLVAYVDAKSLNEDRALNALLTGLNQFAPYSTHCIFLFDAVQGPDINASPSRRVVHSEEKNEINKDAFSDEYLDPIVVYLTRKKVKFAATPFEISRLSGIKQRNERSLGTIPEANKLRKLAGWWCQLNRVSVPGYAPAYCYFSFRKKENAWYLSCQDSNGVRTARVYLTGNTLLADYEMARDQPGIRISVRINGPETSADFLTGLCLVTSNTGDGNAYASRMVLARQEPTPPESTAAFLSHEELLSDELQPDQAKFFVCEEPALLHESNSKIVSSDHFEKLSMYAGDYFLFLPNTYSKDGGLFRLCLTIDILGRVKEQFSASDDPGFGRMPDALIAYGRAEWCDDGLHLSSVNQLHQKSLYLFWIRGWGGQSPQIMQGINLNTDIDKRPCADPCIAVRAGLFPTGKAFKPGPTAPDSIEYKQLDVILSNFLNIDLQTFFFQFYPSIRFKKTSQPMT